mmetsp:Transcript_104246/g.331458  ORF Transcript_104246/g.331458 Transcript_104246/m.331458 type:complete len:395 (+) Transcript_104246:687-1871(+)
MRRGGWHSQSPSGCHPSGRQAPGEHRWRIKLQVPAAPPPPPLPWPRSPTPVRRPPAAPGGGGRRGARAEGLDPPGGPAKGVVLVQTQPDVPARAGALPPDAGGDRAAARRRAGRAAGGGRRLREGQAQLRLRDRQLRGPEQGRAGSARERDRGAELGRRARAREGLADAGAGGPSRRHDAALPREGPGHRAGDLRTAEDPRGAADHAGEGHVHPRLPGFRVGARGVLRLVRRRHPEAPPQRHCPPPRRRRVPAPGGGPALRRGALPGPLQAGGLGRLERVQRRLRRGRARAHQGGRREAQAQRGPLRRDGLRRDLQHAVLRPRLRARALGPLVLLLPLLRRGPAEPREARGEGRRRRGQVPGREEPPAATVLGMQREGVRPQRKFASAALQPEA